MGSQKVRAVCAGGGALLIQTTIRFQHVPQGSFKGPVRFFPDARHQLAVIELDRGAPQIAHFEQLAQETGERRCKAEQKPGRRTDFNVPRKNPDLVPVLADQLIFELEMWLAMHEDLKSTRRVRMLFDHLTESLLDYIKE